MKLLVVKVIHEFVLRANALAQGSDVFFKLLILKFVVCVLQHITKWKTFVLFIQTTLRYNITKQLHRNYIWIHFVLRI